MISVISVVENVIGEIVILVCEDVVLYWLIVDEVVFEIFEVVDDKFVVKEGVVFDYEI